jgi:acetyl-CoA carboxylase biotin carboxylase subunit
MGDKSSAKQTMKDAGVPTIPGSDGLLQDLKHAKEVAKAIKYPVMVKATAGGGGKGMRVCKNDANLKKPGSRLVVKQAAAFGNDGLVHGEIR